MSLERDWQNFINENVEERTIFTYIQGLEEVISNFKPRTMTEKRRLTLAKPEFARGEAFCEKNAERSSNAPRKTQHS